jgi:REP element-mobilizing transposase RayT
MARPLRIEYDGAYYHVMNRGNRRQTVFRQPQDYDLFLAKLAVAAAAFGVDVLAYCLMPNHFHLYVRTAQGNLSRFMQGLLTSFTLSANRRQRSAGHLFQGRFRAELVERERYGNEVSRYLHLNPVRTRAARSLGPEDRRRLLRDYPWSSFAACAGLRRCPPWLVRQETLLSFGGATPAGMKAYRAFVEEGLLSGIGNPAEAVAVRAVIGSEEFLDRVRRTYLLGRSGDRREEPELVRLQAGLAPAQVLDAVAAVEGTTRDELLRRRSTLRQARRRAMYCLCLLCRQRTTLTGLGRLFGVSVAGLTRSRVRVAAGTDPQDLERFVEAVRRQLSIA